MGPLSVVTRDGIKILVLLTISFRNKRKENMIFFLFRYHSFTKRKLFSSTSFITAMVSLILFSLIWQEQVHTDMHGNVKNNNIL